MFEVIQSDPFAAWFDRVKDVQTRARILVRLDRVALGHLGDHKPVGGGISELRFAFGPGWRIYFTVRGGKLIVLLMGGDKGSQAKDIAAAKAIARSWP